MDRLQKKCFIASAGLHSLLAVILLIGPALAPKSKSEDVPILDFIPLKTVDSALSGGGNPQARLPAAPPPERPPAPAPEPEPVKQPEVAPPPEPKPEPKPTRVRQPEKAPEPEPEPEKPTRKSEPDPDAIDPDRKPRKPQISTKLVTRTPSDSKAKAKAAAEARAREAAKAAADARRALARQFSSAADRLGSDVSGATVIDFPGPGGGGVPYANFRSAVATVYERAWIVPDGLTDSDLSASASVTIARDGTVVSARITRHSGNQELDRSVQAALERVKFAAPLPDGAKEDQRTITIRFKPKVRQGIG